MTPPTPEPELTEDVKDNIALSIAKLSASEDEYNIWWGDDTSLGNLPEAIKRELDIIFERHKQIVAVLKAELAEKDTELNILRDLRLLHLGKESSMRDIYLENIGRNKANAEWRAKINLSGMNWSKQ